MSDGRSNFNGCVGEKAVRIINSTALIGLILLCYTSFRIPKEATLRHRAGRQHGARSETFWASCIMLFVLPGKDGRVTGCTEPPPESQMDYSLSPPLLSSTSLSLQFAGNSNAVCSQLQHCGLSCVWLWNKSNTLFFLSIPVSLSVFLFSFNPRFLLQLLYLSFVSPF